MNKLSHRASASRPSLSTSREANSVDRSRSSSGARLRASRPAKKPKAAFLVSPESFDSVYIEKHRRALRSLLTIVGSMPDGLDVAPASNDVSGVEILFTGWGSPKLDAARLKRFPSLRMVFHAGGSVKFMLSEEFWARGIRLTCTARANAVPVAEFTLAQIILGLKHAWRSARRTQAARDFVRDDAAVPSVYGSVVGIISVGVIGRMVVERLRALDVHTICYDPYLSAKEARALRIEACTLEELFARSDVVSCHAPLLRETTHLLRERHFASMKPGATFINTARGAVVHEAEMIAVLKRRPDLFAALDVTDPEPPAKESPLYDLPNVFLTPHIAGSIGPECHRMGEMIVGDVRRYCAGKPLAGEVLREKLSLLA